MITMITEENRKLHQLYNEFSNAFPLESLKDMTLEQYTNLERADSFCYWIESKTTNLGSVWGGSSYKFGIYRYVNSPKGENGGFDDSYAWNSSLGKTADEAFEKVKSAIIRLAEYGREGNLAAIEAVKELWPVIKWKIAFLYSNESIIPYYSLERLRVIAEVLGMKGTKNASIADIQFYLIDKREGKDIFEYAKLLDGIWKENEDNSKCNQTKVWMWAGDADTFNKDRLVCGSTVSHQIRDYSQYKDYETMRSDFQKAHGNTDVAVPDAYWKFMKNVHVGDIVVVFKNIRVGNANHHTMLGWGLFTSELINDKESENPLQRFVEWKGILEEPITTGIVKNTLFFHRTTDAQAKEIKELLGIIKDTNDNSHNNFWLVGYAFGATNSQYDRFIKEGIWESRHNDNSVNDQQLLALAKTISKQDIIILKSTSTKGPKHDQPFMRIKAVGVVTSNIETSKIEGATLCRCNVDYVNLDEKDFDGQVYGSYRKAIHKADSKIQDIIDYVNSLLFKETKPQMKYKEYIDLLHENYNLVLTGAPGTGKTYMAQAIADEMGAITKFVQFHPSYDYTDFVEGLRPVEKGEDQMGFRREDGIFKEFCREAIKNIEDSLKTVESLTKELSWQEKLEHFVENASENGTKFKTVNGSEFSISEMHSHTILVHNETNEKTTQIAVNADEILDLLTKEIPLNNVRDIRNHYDRKYGTQPDSYAFVIIREIRKMKTKTTVVEASKVEKKPFVFIIDEINRGEASKIFGELFYAIDPGYRGKKDVLVQTQYQNLVPETDTFAKGFYVPDNVYILATMNDIDRSVESMDFAMRRRFTWKEVTPEDTQEMLDSFGESLAAEAKETMKRLNKVISETDGLGAAYSIGPAYFLKLGKNGGNFIKLWNMNIEPLLREYLRGFRKTNEILGKFREAYFGEETQEEILSDTMDLLDED